MIRLRQVEQGTLFCNSSLDGCTRFAWASAAATQSKCRRGRGGLPAGAPIDSPVFHIRCSRLAGADGGARALPISRRRESYRYRAVAAFENKGARLDVCHAPSVYIIAKGKVDGLMARSFFDYDGLFIGTKHDTNEGQRRRLNARGRMRYRGDNWNGLDFGWRTPRTGKERAIPRLTQIFETQLMCIGQTPGKEEEKKRRATSDGYCKRGEGPHCHCVFF